METDKEITPEYILDKYVHYTQRHYRFDVLKAMEEYCDTKVKELKQQLKTETELRKRWEIEYYELRDHLKRVIESHEGSK